MELMVVVAVIAILIMILAPNLVKVREKARAAYCRNNLRQYGIAMNQYMADNNGFFIYPGMAGARAGYSPDGENAINQVELGEWTGDDKGRVVSDQWGN